MSRKKAREIVLCLVFEKDYHKDVSCEKLYEYMIENGQVEEIYNSFEEKNEKNEDNYSADNIKNKKNVKLNEDDLKYIKKIFFGIFENVEYLDNLISESSIGWEHNRISKISMALLRIAVYEALYADDIPVGVSVNEAVMLSKRYDNSDAYTFINGVLGAVVKNISR